MKKKVTLKKLALNKESLLRLDPPELREVVGGISAKCTNTAECTNSCAQQETCACSYRTCP